MDESMDGWIIGCLYRWLAGYRWICHTIDENSDFAVDDGNGYRCLFTMIAALGYLSIFTLVDEYLIGRLFVIVTAVHQLIDVTKHPSQIRVPVRR